MTRILLAVLLAALAAACTNPSATDPGDSEPDAEAFKTEMDAEAATLLPDLIEAVGGQLNGMQATFYERGGFGIWDYTASGTVYALPGTDDQALTAGASSLEEHGFTVETDAEKKSLRASKGNVRVIVASAFPDDDKGIASLNLTMSSAEAISDGDDFAENAPAEDYLAFLK
jgi:hypothetical protein